MNKRWLFLLPLILCLCTSQRAISQALNANFSASPNAGCVPIRVAFQDLSTGNPTRWLWDFGDGRTSTLQNPSTTYTSVGTYTVKLTVYRGNDSSVIVKPNYITVLPVPDVAFGATPVQGCFPLTVTFSDSSTAGSGSIVSWQWDFGDGNISNQQNPTHTYTAAGVFNVTLTVRNSNGCSKTLSKINLITVASGVTADFTTSNVPTCLLPATVNFTNTSSGPVVSYFWDFGDGNTSTLANPSHVYNAAGIYNVKLIVRNATGCTDTIIKPGVIQVGIISSNFNAPAQACVGTSVNMQNTSSPLASLVSSFWDFGDGTTSTSTDGVHTYSTPGTYTIKLVSNFGLCRDSSRKTIVISPKPTAGFTGNNLFGCTPPLTTTFTNSSAGGTTYAWDFGDGATATSANPSHTYTQTGTFTVTLITTNANGCRDTMVKPSYVVIEPPKITGVGPLPVQGCVPYTTNFTPTINSGTAITSYFWDFGDGSTSTAANPVHTYTVEGIYTIKLRIVNASGCSDSIVISNAVKVGNKPHSLFTATPRLACAQETINFSDLSTAPLPDEWFWQFGDGGTSTLQNPSYQYNDTGSFNVTLITTRNGCKDTLKINDFIYIKPPIARFIDSFDCSNQKLHFFKDRSLGALTYAWTFGDGASSTQQNPTHQYADTGRYQVKLKVTNGACQYEASRDVLVLNEKAAFSIIDSNACKSTFKTFIAAGIPRNIANYSWDFGEGNAPQVVNNPVTLHRFANPGAYNVLLKITDLNNCTDTISHPVTVAQIGPIAAFNSSQTVCIRNVTTFTDSSRADLSNPIVQWRWNYGDTTGWHTFNTTANPFVHTYTAGGVYNVTLVVTDAAGCSDSLTKIGNADIRDPKANFTSADTTVCLGTQVNIIDNSSGSITTRLWDLGDGTTSTSNAIQHIYNVEGAYTIKLHVTDNAGCQDSITKPQYIKVFNAKARFAMSDSFTTCPPLFTTFTNQSINAAQVFWDFGNGNTSSLINPSHTYTQSGTYTVTLAVTGNGGCTDTARKQVKILGPSGTFSYNPFVGCSPLQVTFNAVAQNTVSYTFDFSDGNTAVTTNPSASHSYTVLGDYVPKMILSDSFGCRVPVIGADTIRVKGIKTYIKQLPNYVICDSSMVQFQDSIVSNDVLQAFEWNFGDGTTSTLRSPAHFYSTTGIYTVTFKVTTASGCTSIDTLRTPIRVVRSPQVAVSGLTEGCVPTTAQFNGQWLNQDTSAMTWQWNFGNGTTSTQQNPTSITYNTAGTYTVTLIAKNSSGCTDTFAHPVTVYALPNIDAGPDKLVCRGQAVTITATGGTNYVWTANPTLSCTNCASPSARPDSLQKYYVQGTDSHGCINRDSIIVTVKQPFVMRVGPGDTLCTGQSRQLQASGAENYTWSPARGLSATNIANPIARPDSTVRYQVIGYDSVGCFRDTGYVTLRVFPKPKVDILENQITLNVGDPVQLHSTASQDVTRLRWSPTINLSCTDCPNPTANPRQNITYTLTATNAGNCTSQDQVNITLLCKESNIFVPNTFSPNNDGANDVFYPRGKGLFSVKSMRVFNRWGELVFEKTNFLANDPTAGWDGTQRGVALTPDVYVYVMEIICDNNVLYSVKGNVTLVK